MTEATEVEVTQADIDAARSYWTSISDEYNGWETLSGDECENAVQAFARHRLATRTDATPVAEASEMPGSNGGFTMATFKASDVPVGTNLYTHPPATDVAALVEALQVIQRETTAVTPELENLELCVGTIHSYVTRILALFTKGQP